jgi:hypothetical protein
MGKKNAIDWQVSPTGLLPPSLLKDFYSKDPSAIQKAKVWVSNNGRIILFTKKLIKGDEDISVTDDGVILLTTSNYSSLTEMRLLAHRKSKELYAQVIALGEDKKLVLDLLKKHEPLF